MSCAKTLRFATLCLGLATYAVTSRAAQPASDYDLEPLLRRYGGDANQIMSDDDALPVAKAPASKRATSVAATRPNPHVAPASYSSAEENTQESEQSEPSQPSLLPASVRVQRSTVPPARRSSDWSQPQRRGNRPGAVRSSAYAEGTTEESIAQPTPPGSGTRSIQSPRSASPGSARTWTSAGEEGAAQSTIPEGSPHAMPESIGPGNEMSPYGDQCNQCSDCCNDCDYCFNPCGCCGWYGAVDYLFVRPTFSDAQAFITRRGSTGPNNEVVATDTVVQQHFDYQSSVRAYLGYRFCDCGGELRFTYWNYENNGSIQSPVSNGSTLIVGGQFMIRANEDGQSLLNESGLTMNVYDIDYCKCSCFGGNNSCDACNCCPIWTLKYNVGVRIADVRRFDNSRMLGPLVTDPSPPTIGLLNADFMGAGPRVGLEGRRFFHGNCASLFARTNFSLLMGQYSISESVETPDTTTGDITSIEHFIDKHDRVIPVAEIELGGDWQLSNCIRLSAGYMFQAWWDLGAFEQVTEADFPHVENSNIMSFDGLFARVEVCF